MYAFSVVGKRVVSDLLALGPGMVMERSLALWPVLLALVAQSQEAATSAAKAASLVQPPPVV
jgi:hypothetical protein